MNVTGKLSFMQDDGKVLGAGDWFADNDEVGSFCYSGIWQGGKVIALVLDEHSDSEVVKERGNLIVKAVNAHDKLVEALKLAQEVSLVGIFSAARTGLLTRADDARKAALAAAGEPI